MTEHRGVPRRGFLTSALALGGATLAGGTLLGGGAAHAAAADQAEPQEATAVVPGEGGHVVLLGTSAGPVPFVGRVGIASALVVDGHAYLVDMGHSTFDQIHKAGLRPEQIEHLFVTHLHSDHLADVWTLPWLRFGGRHPFETPLHIWGPGSAGALPPGHDDGSVPVINPDDPVPGIGSFIASSMAASAYDLNLRMRDEGWPDIRTLLETHELELPDVGADAGNICPPMEPFEVFADDRVRVSAVLVDHPPVFPSYAFRFDTRYGSVVFSGDTTLTPNMVTLADGADLLVHEAIDVQALRLEPGMSEDRLRHLTESHSDVTKLGALAEEAGVGTLVLSHLAPGSVGLPDSGWRAKASRGFAGEVVVGHDLDVLTLGATGG